MARPVLVSNIYKCDECIICMEPLSQPATTEVLFEKVSSDPTTLVATPCGHVYHRLCLQQWLQTPGERSCPSCRTVVEQAEMIINASAHGNIESGLSSSPASVNSNVRLIDRLLNPAHKTLRQLYNLQSKTTCDNASSKTDAMDQDCDLTNDNRREVLQIDESGEDLEGLIDVTTLNKACDELYTTLDELRKKLDDLTKRLDVLWRKYELRKRRQEERRKKWMERIEKCKIGIGKVRNYLIRKL